jgi:serine/threonine protein kinase
MSALIDRLNSTLTDRYTIDREIGYGGMASVYLAEDLKHHRKVAVKVLRPELAATLGTERFLREIEIAAQLNHPHILPLLDSGEADGFFWEGRLPTTSKRRVQIMIDPSGGRTRIRIVELPGEDEALNIVPPIIASILTVGLLAATISQGMEPVVAFLLGGTLWGGHYAVIRTIYRRFLEKRTDVLSGLFESLSRLALG